MIPKKKVKLLKCLIQKFVWTGIIVFSMLFPGEFGYPVEKKGARLGSQFLFQGIGDWSYRQTNIYLKDYDFVGGWSYAKIVWYSESLPFGVYISGVIANSNRGKAWENNYVLGIGLEKYIFEDVKKLQGLFKNIRFYFEYLKIGYTNEDAEEWVPSYDLRIGFDVYKDHGIGKENINKQFWSEVWGNLAWQKTNFYIEDYKSIVAGINVKAGLRLLKNTPLSPMPYMVGELSWTGKHDFFWQNRGLFGAGLRLMPFAKSKLDLWNRFKIFAEYFFTSVYFKEKPPANVPGHDFRIGIVYSIGLWK